MSVRFPLHAPREHVQTRRVRSHVSSVSPVSEFLSMDNSVKVRLCVFFWALMVVGQTWRTLSLLSIDFLKLNSNMPEKKIEILNNKKVKPVLMLDCVEATVSNSLNQKGFYLSPSHHSWFLALPLIRYQTLNRTKWCQANIKWKRSLSFFAPIRHVIEYNWQSLFIWNHRLLSVMLSVWVCLCPDVDECLVANLCPGQLCLNTPGSYTCRSCGAGFQLSKNSHTCEGKNVATFCYGKLVIKPIDGQGKRNILALKYEQRRPLQCSVICLDMNCEISAITWQLSLIQWG